MRWVGDCALFVGIPAAHDAQREGGRLYRATARFCGGVPARSGHYSQGHQAREHARPQQ